MARALAGDPPAPSMDEPFGAVDPIARDRLQQEFLDLQEKLHKTVMFVTHDVDEGWSGWGQPVSCRQPGRGPSAVRHAGGGPEPPGHAIRLRFHRSGQGAAAPGGDAHRSDGPLHSARREAEHNPRSGERRRYRRRDPLGRCGGRGRARLLGWVEPGRSYDGPGDADGSSTVARYMRPFEARAFLDASLKAAFAEMLQNDAAWVAVLDKDRYVGVLTPDSLWAALRRLVGGDPVPI